MNRNPKKPENGMATPREAASHERKYATATSTAATSNADSHRQRARTRSIEKGDISVHSDADGRLRSTSRLNTRAHPIRLTGAREQTQILAIQSFLYPAVAATVEKVNEHSERQPDQEAQPCCERQGDHERA